VSGGQLAQLLGHPVHHPGQGVLLSRGEVCRDPGSAAGWRRIERCSGCRHVDAAGVVGPAGRPTHGGDSAEPDRCGIGPAADSACTRLRHRGRCRPLCGPADLEMPHRLRKGVQRPARKDRPLRRSAAPGARAQLLCRKPRTPPRCRCGGCQNRRAADGFRGPEPSTTPWRTTHGPICEQGSCSRGVLRRHHPRTARRGVRRPGFVDPVSQPVSDALPNPDLQLRIHRNAVHVVGERRDVQRSECALPGRSRGRGRLVVDQLAAAVPADAVTGELRDHSCGFRRHLPGHRSW
jgi:hypothetical protein